ncbi:MAG: hypothetical protein E6R03_16380 [Hyphomicrobiaceae bacterium]|nr:MAG: hypothetical protein E6R03_16380 [Hyphomicrobiaceae bacterium]
MGGTPFKKVVSARRQDQDSGLADQLFALRMTLASMRRSGVKGGELLLDLGFDRSDLEEAQAMLTSDPTDRVVRQLGTNAVDAASGSVEITGIRMRGDKLEYEVTDDHVPVDKSTLLALVRDLFSMVGAFITPVAILRARRNWELEKLTEVAVLLHGCKSAMRQALQRLAEINRRAFSERKRDEPAAPKKSNIILPGQDDFGLR